MERERKPFKIIITIKCYVSAYVSIVKFHCFILFWWIMNGVRISSKILANGSKSEELKYFLFHNALKVSINYTSQMIGFKQHVFDFCNQNLLIIMLKYSMINEHCVWDKFFIPGSFIDFIQKVLFLLSNSRAH